jgi:LemA protein
MIPAIIAVVVLGLPVLWLIGTYNGFVRIGQHVRESWSGIDVELKRRYDLIPNLVSTAKGYASHEKEVFERVVQARQAAVSSTGSPASQAEDENQLVGAMRSMFALVESYPKIKADQQFLNLQNELVDTEDRIAASRRFYNANVRDLNARTAMFPSIIIANMFGFKAAEYFEIDDSSMRHALRVDIAEKN